MLLAHRRQRELALKAGGISQARLSALELQPGRLTFQRLLLLLAALDLDLAVRLKQKIPSNAEW